MSHRDYCAAEAASIYQEAAGDMEDDAPDQEQREVLYGRALLDKARRLGWPDDDGEGALEYLMRRCYEQGHEDALLRGQDI